MNTFLAMGIIATCTAVFLGVVALLTIQGVDILVAVIGVYLFAYWTMLSMQRKARDNFDSKTMRAQRDSHIHRTGAKDFNRHSWDANPSFQD